MACGNIGSRDEEIFEGRLAEAAWLKEEYNVIIELSEETHSYVKHGADCDVRVFEKYSVKRIWHRNETRNSTKFVSEEIHRECRERILFHYKNELEQAMGRGDRFFNKTIEFGQTVGHGFSKGVSFGDVVPCTATKVTISLENDGWAWRETTNFPNATAVQPHVRLNMGGGW